MGTVYTACIACYGLFIRLGAQFNQKARLWVEGRRGLFKDLATALENVDRSVNPVTWFHVSSLGEFEQGRPVIEAFRKRWPEKRILLTFFSPSGYEVRKTYDQADFVFYLPLDTPGNVGKFIGIVRPERVFFVKYDFWFNYLRAIGENRIPLYFISAVFREDQHFFSWYGGWFRRHLAFVTRFFVQDQLSEDLLRSVGIRQVTVTGDTRFDRVFALSQQRIGMPLVERFCGGKQVLIAGSTWEPDEAIILPLADHGRLNMKCIIAPHDTSPARVKSIREKLARKAICHSELDEDNADRFDILIIDSVGILSQLYRYAAFAFIGGGFGNGIHNIQEPVTFGVPVFFGPKYQKFSEARDLIALGGAFSVGSYAELEKKVLEIMEEPQEWKRLSAICKKYVEEHRGATNRIMTFIEQVNV